MRIASNSTTSTAATPTPTPAGPSGVTFKATLANSSEQANAESGPMSGGSKMHSGASAAGRTSSKQEKAQSSSGVSNDGAPTITPVPPADQKSDSAKDVSSGHENGTRASGGSSGTSAEPTDSHFVSASLDLSQQMSVSQPAAGAAERAVTTLKQLNVAAPLDKAVDGAVQTDAQTIPSAATQAGASIVAQTAGETFKLQLELPMSAILPNKGDSIQPAGKAAQKNATDAAGSKNSDLANTTDTGKGKGPVSVSAVSDASSHGAQGNGQFTQNSQTDASQAAGVMPKVVDSGASHAQPVPMHAVSHEPATTLGTPAGPQDATRQSLQRGVTGSNPLDGDETAATSGINTAKLIQTMAETEMRVGMHSSEFGNISIRTSVSQQQMLAQISLDHSGLSQAISAHVSTMQTKLGNDSGLHTLIEVNHQGASSSGEQENSPQREQRAFAPSARTESAAVPEELDVGLSPGALVSASDGYRLDIRA